MVLILAPAASLHAVALASAFGPGGAAVLTCADLAAGASALAHPERDRSWISVQARRLHLAEIEGVVNLLPAVLPAMLTCYEEAEREYQAAELHAWLTLLLASLACPVVSRPGAFGLAGPVRGPLGWRRVAARSGVPAQPLELDSDGEPTPQAVGGRARVSVIGSRAVGGGVGASETYTLRLAQSAGVEHLRAWYAGDPPVLVGASVIPDARDPLVRAALVEHLRA